MAKETTNSSPECQETTATTETFEKPLMIKKPEKDGEVRTGEPHTGKQFCPTKNVEKSDPMEEPGKNDTTEKEQPSTEEEAKQNGTTEQSDPNGVAEKLMNTATTEKPEETGTSKKRQPPANNQPKKRLRFGPSQRNKSGPWAKNGSYRNYYARRYNGVHGDDRLPIVRDACKLQGKNISILDIGCNDGTVTIEMASMDRCIEAVGVDIDPNLVGTARKKLREYVEKEANKSEAERINPAIQGPIPKLKDSLALPLRRSLRLMKDAKKNNKKDGTATGSASTSVKFPHNVTFRREDFAQKAPTRTSQEIGKYDVVLCLSVTKWVHFAGGDEALQRLFRRIYDCLKVGGVLILEPQPQKSYKSAIRKGMAKKDLKGERNLKPHQFVEYLTKTVRFSKMRMLRDVRYRGQAFNRPIMAFYKGPVRPSKLIGSAVSQDAEAVPEVVPSDDEGDEDPQPEEHAEPQAQEAPEQQNGAEQNSMEVENDDGNLAEEVRQEGREEDDREDVPIDENVNGSGEHHKQERKDQAEPELTLQATAAETSQVARDASVPREAEENEGQPAQVVKGSSPKKAICEDTALPSSGSKRNITGQDIEGIIAQRPKRSKLDDVVNPNEPKSPEGFC